MDSDSINTRRFTPGDVDLPLSIGII